MLRKCAITSIVMLAFGTSLVIGAKNLISYQGKVSDSSGLPVNSQAVAVVVQFFDAAVGGSPQAGFSETHLVDINNGIFTITVGSKTADGVPSSVFDGTKNVYLSITINSEEQVPRPQIAYVPFSLSAAGTQIDCSDYPGTVDAGTYCIDQDWSGDTTSWLYYGQIKCYNRGMRLCYWEEYAQACVLWQNNQITMFHMLSPEAWFMQMTADRSGINNRGFGHEAAWSNPTCYDDNGIFPLTEFATQTFHYRCCISKTRAR